VVATGGYAELIAHSLREIQIVHPQLTLDGLRIVANLNCSRHRQSKIRGRVGKTPA
jgi:hypothetical protein